MKSISGVTCALCLIHCFGISAEAAPEAVQNVKPSADPPPSERIVYVNPDIPDVPKPEYKGERYEALVPATLDLAERMSLSINAFTEGLSKNADLEAFWVIDLLSDPPRMDHNFSDHVRIKYFQMLPYLRTATGSEQNLDREHQVMKLHLMQQGPDGLIYTPMIGRPWGTSPSNWGPSGDQYATLTWDNGRMLAAFSSYAQAFPDGPWAEAARKLVEEMKEVIVEKDTIAYVPQHSKVLGDSVDKSVEPPTKSGVAPGGNVAHGLGQYDRMVTGKKTDATRLAHKMLSYIMGDAKYFAQDGEFLTEAEDLINIHFHEHTMSMMFALELVKMTGDEELLDRVVKAYRWASKPAYNHQPLVGFFPEFDQKPDEWADISGGFFKDSGYLAETCGVADMCIIAIMLSELGHDYWDDADRILRNQLAENQLTGLAWLYDGHLEEAGIKPSDPSQRSMAYYTTDNVANRVVGTFAGWGLPNDWVSPYSVQVMNCCTVNGARGLYYVWKNIITFDENSNRLRVNLLLNRASQWADVDSHIPYSGKVEVKAKQDLNLEIRLPEWVRPEEASCTVDGKSRKLNFDGRYALVGKVMKNETTDLSFPIPERTDKISINLKEYSIVRRGNTVVSIDPPGKARPYYQRGHYRGGETLFKKKTRFVPEKELEW